MQACTDPVTRRLAERPALAVHAARGAQAGCGRRADADLREGSDLSWCVADPATDECLGAVSVMHLLEGDGTGGEVGYWAHPRRAAAASLSEAVRLAVRHAFVPVADGGLGRRRLRLNVADGNVASQRVALRSGSSRSAATGSPSAWATARTSTWSVTTCSSPSTPRADPRPARERVSTRGPAWAMARQAKAATQTEAAGGHPGTEVVAAGLADPAGEARRDARARPCARRTPSRRRRRSAPGRSGCGTARPSAGRWPPSPARRRR